MNELKEIPEIQEQDIGEKDFEDLGQGLDPTEEDLEDSQGLDLNSMAPELPGGIYSLFQSIIKSPDVSRVCNVTKEERGILPFTTMGSRYVSQLANQFRHPIFAAFFINQAEIVEETSMGKAGWLPELIVTSKRYSNVKNDSPKDNSPLEDPQKKKSSFNIFSKKK